MASRTFNGVRGEVKEQLDELKDSPLSRALRGAFDALPPAAPGEGAVSISAEQGSDNVSAYITVQARVTLPRA